MLTCLVPVLFKFYIQSVLKLKKNNSGAKGLIKQHVSALFGHHQAYKGLVLIKVNERTLINTISL